MERLQRLAILSSSVGALSLAYIVYRRYCELQEVLCDATERKNRLAVQLMRARNSRFQTAESIRIGRSFKPRPSDIFVVTYPKCGTTWVTQIVHALRTNASMDFGEITEVVPWDILAHDCKQDLDADHVAEPRVWKCHEAWKDVAKGGKYIYVARNPEDALYSFFKFLPSFLGLQAGDIDQEAFAAAIFAGASHSGQIWDHFLGWWEQRHREDVLWVFFEDLAKDLRKEVLRIARFMSMGDAPPSLIDAVVSVSSFESMSAKENQHHYDDHFIRKFICPMMGLDVNTASHEVTKVRAGGGKVGARRAILPAIKARLEAKWAAVLTQPTGCANYDEFCRSVRAERCF